MATVRSRHEHADEELDDGEDPAAGDQVGRDLLVAERAQPEEVDDWVVDHGHGDDAPAKQLSSFLVTLKSRRRPIYTGCFLYFATTVFTRGLSQTFSNYFKIYMIIIIDEVKQQGEKTFKLCVCK